MVATHGLQGNVGLLVGGCRMLDGVRCDPSDISASDRGQSLWRPIRCAAISEGCKGSEARAGGRDCVADLGNDESIARIAIGVKGRATASVGTLVRLCTDAKNPPVSPGTSRTPIARSLYTNTAGLQVTQAHLKTAQRQQTSPTPGPKYGK